VRDKIGGIQATNTFDVYRDIAAGVISVAWIEGKENLEADAMIKSWWRLHT
jgi:hypothetical protein